MAPPAWRSCASAGPVGMPVPLVLGPGRTIPVCMHSLPALFTGATGVAPDSNLRSWASRPEATVVPYCPDHHLQWWAWVLAHLPKAEKEWSHRQPPEQLQTLEGEALPLLFALGLPREHEGAAAGMGRESACRALGAGGQACPSCLRDPVSAAGLPLGPWMMQRHEVSWQEPCPGWVCLKG